MDEKNITKLTLSLLGPFQANLDGELINHFPTDKVRALLAYLAMEADCPHRRDTLAGLLWTEWPNRQARRNLRKSLYWLRQTLDKHRAGISDELLTITRQTVQLNKGTFILDVSNFLGLLAEVQSHTHHALYDCPACLDRLRKAVGLYKGEFLTGFSLADALTFEEWLLVKRERLQQQVLNTLSRLTKAYEQRDEYELVQEYATRQLVLEPWREQAHCQLMRALALNNQRSEALAQYGTCRRILEKELAVEPAAETTALYEQIRSGTFQRQARAHRVRLANLPREERASERDEGRRDANRPVNLRTNETNGWNTPFAPTDQDQNGINCSNNRVRGRKHDLPRPVADQLSKEASPNAAARRGSTPLHNFSVQFTPFVGRQTELAQSIDYLTNPACRLLTLCGPGGMGKTRLSIEVSKQIAPKLASYDGIYFIDLAEIISPNLLVPALVNSLGVALQGTISFKAQLINYLQAKKILLVIDNFEHLVEGADLLVEILSAAPGVKMLITSREPLNLRAEWRLMLDGLAYPLDILSSDKLLPSNPREAQRGLDLISSYSAIQLFVQTAARLQPGFSPSAEEQAAIVRICQLVAGMPLAIEIAAAWIRMYDCEAIAEEIARHLDLMVTPLRDMPSRHRSMRAVFDHSWRLLLPSEQTALAQISVFRGGFSMKAALAVTDATHLEFAALLDKSLLRRTQGGRLEIHELLRQFAAEPLGDQADKVRDRHAKYYTTFLQKRTTALQGGKQQKALTEIDQEIKNCSAAWEYAISEGNIEAIGTGLDGLFHFYDIRSRFQEGELMFRQAAVNLVIDPRNREQAIVKAKLQARQGWFTFHLGQTEQSWTLLQNTLSSLRALQAEHEMVFNLNYLGAVARHLAEYESAQAYLSEALAIAQAMGDQLGASIALNIHGQIASLQGEYEKARELCRQSLQIKRQIGDRWGMTFSLTYLGRVELMLGEYQEAKELLRESMTISETFGDRRGLAFALLNLGNVAQAQGETQRLEAQRLYQESLYLYNEIGSRQEASLTLSKLGEVACELEEWSNAKSYFRHALSIALEIGSAPAMLAGLLGTATLHTRLNASSRAIPLLIFIQNYASASPSQRAQAKQLQAEMAQVPDLITNNEKQESNLVAFVRGVLRTHFGR